MDYFNYFNRKLFSGRLDKKNFGNGLVVWFVLGWAFQYSGLLFVPFSFIFLIGLLSLFVRRLQDLGHSGWWIFFPIPVLLWIYLILWEGQKESNKYGERPSEGIKFFDALLNKNQVHSEKNQNISQDIVYCTKCGTKQENDGRFCTNCGFNLIKVNDK